MADVFPPVGIDLPTPDWGFKETPDVEVSVNKLGDGYESRELIGLNPVKKTYEPEWSVLDEAVAQAAYEFILARLKWKAVLWTHPVTGVVLKVVAQSVSITYDTFNNAVLSITFKTDHNPG